MLSTEPSRDPVASTPESTVRSLPGPGTSWLLRPSMLTDARVRQPVASLSGTGWPSTWAGSSSGGRITPERSQARPSKLSRTLVFQ